MKISKVISVVLIIGSTSIFNSCGGGSESTNYANSNHDEGNATMYQQTGPTLSFRNEMDVYNELSGYSFKDDNGHVMTFNGRYPAMSLSMNGQFIAQSFEVLEISSQNGYQCATVRVNGPYGTTTLLVGELDNKYSNSSPVYIVDMNDTNNLFYRTK